MKLFFRLLSAALGCAAAIVFSLCTAAASSTPSEISVSADSGDTFCTYPLSVDYGELPAAAEPDGGSAASDGRIKLFGIIPVKNVSVRFTERPVVSLGGQPFGIRLYSEGIMVARTGSVQTSDGERFPAADAGICSGDLLLTADGKKLLSSSELSELTEKSGGRSIVITGKRGERDFRTTIRPSKDIQLGIFRIGLWVRDSCAGIGTITFTDVHSCAFAGLGHGIIDSDSGQIVPLAEGDIVPAVITGITRGSAGRPGSLCGSFASDKSAGTIAANSEKGIYGFLSGSGFQGQDIPVAFRQEVRRGEAKIYTTISGSAPEWYDVRITDISYDNIAVTKNMVIEITDKRLLESTGGIIQGMSGSPIVQNGCLVGAVTHVFVNDPCCGYGIFAENMFDLCRSVVQKSGQKAS